VIALCVKADARQFFDNGRRSAHRHSMYIVQNVRQPFDTRAYPVGRGSPLIGGDSRMLPAYFPPALRAFTDFYLIAANLRLWRGGNIGDGNDLRPGLAQRAPAAGAIIRPHRYRHRLARRPFRRGSEAEGSLAGFTSRRPRIGLARALRKWRRRTSSLQLLNLGTQLLNHPALIQNDLNQFFSAE
jgi:hypothetical protein